MQVFANLIPQARVSARNFLHYLALRQVDLKPTQDDLMRLGLSSLGRMEAHVMATLQAVRRALRSLSAGCPLVKECLPEAEPPVDFETGRMRLLRF